MCAPQKERRARIVKQAAVIASPVSRSSMAPTQNRIVAMTRVRIRTVLMMRTIESEWGPDVKRKRNGAGHPGTESNLARGIVSS